ncbi:MAG: hypothetical protein GY869_01395 [Planctomycetes bacterium]|nr:hypothetical protein [Planctomycetota bacterium]
MNNKGLTVFELLVTVIVMAIITITVFSILHHAHYQTRFMTEEMMRCNLIQHSLDLIVDDVTRAATKHYKLEIDQRNLDNNRQTSHLTISSFSLPDQDNPDLQIDWVAVPRFEEKDLVLFRREIGMGSQDDKFIPVCDNLSSFQVTRLTAEGLPTLDSTLPLVKISAQVYRPGEPDHQRVYVAQRTFCSQRFVGAKPIIR